MDLTVQLMDRQEHIRQPVNDEEYEKLKELPRKTPWAERRSQIHRSFPLMATFNWKKAFDEDPDLFANVLRGILGLEGTRSHTWGPRPMPEMDLVQNRLKQWRGEDHTDLTFKEAFFQLTQGLTERDTAELVGFNKSLVHRLLSGKVEPDVYVMEQVAKAFGKQPGFFLEYRMVYIINAFAKRLEQYGESNVSIFRKLMRLDQEG